MRAAAALTFVAAMSPVAAYSQPAGGVAASSFFYGPSYFPRLADHLAHLKKTQTESFAADLNATYKICLSKYMAYDCGTQSRNVTDYDITFSQCWPLDIAKDKNNLRICEYLVERKRDNAKLGCARVVGWFDGYHGAGYESAETPMHFDAKGNWKLGRSPDETAASARKDDEARRLAKNGKPVPNVVPSRYSNLHCNVDPTTFF